LTIHLNFNLLEKEWGFEKLEDRYMMASSISKIILGALLLIKENSGGGSNRL